MILTLSEDVSLPELGDVSKVLSLEFGDLESEVSWLEGQLSGDISAADIMAHDLSSLHLGTSDTILMRWTESEALRPHLFGLIPYSLHHFWHRSISLWKQLGQRSGVICTVCSQATRWCPRPAWTCLPHLQIR